ncbi:ABC transporter permease [Limosilactobacillus allomucosae]|uniref:ABC transporter permease n=1 Tax=Limosilactobacillus allomucosae TaxID=3142938 RepID=A0AAU7C252_9LACO
MGKILTIAKMVLKKRLLSPAYYWMILTPVTVFLIGIGFVGLMHRQNNNSRPIIAVVANSDIKKAIESEKSDAYQVNRKVDVTDDKRLKSYLTDGVLDGILYVSDDFSKITYRYNADSNKSLPIEALEKNLNGLSSQFVASSYGLNIKQWSEIVKQPTIKQQAINKKEAVKLKNSNAAQNLGEVIVMLAFVLLVSYINITGTELGIEKSNHLIEGILAAVPARKHFAGKMLGIGFLITLQLLIYLVIGGLVCLVAKQTDLMTWFDPVKYFGHVDAEYLVIVVLLTLLSIILYIFLAAIFASFVSKSEDISQAVSIVGTIMMVPYLLSFLAQENPNTGVIRFLSYMPFMSQGIMPVRLARAAVSYQAGWITVLFALSGAIIMYFWAERLYVKNAFSYSSDSPLKTLFNRILKNN